MSSEEIEAAFSNLDESGVEAALSAVNIHNISCQKITKYTLLIIKGFVYILVVLVFPPVFPGISVFC